LSDKLRFANTPLGVVSSQNELWQIPAYRYTGVEFILQLLARTVGGEFVRP